MIPIDRGEGDTRKYANSFIPIHEPDKNILCEIHSRVPVRIATAFRSLRNLSARIGISELRKNHSRLNARNYWSRQALDWKSSLSDPCGTRRGMKPRCWLGHWSADRS